MSTNDFELTSEESGSSTGQTNNNLSCKEKIREITASGNLRIPRDEVWSYWQVLNSQNYFERLFLDIEQAGKITNETVTNHYEEIRRYLEKWRERESAGISFAQSHGGCSLSELNGKLESAYTELRGKPAREEYVKSQREEKRRKGLKSLEPMIKMALADKVLTYDEKTMIYQEGIKAGLSIRDIDELIKSFITEVGDVKDETVSERGEKTDEVPEKQTEIKYCERCGNKIDAGALFCGECGNKSGVRKTGKNDDDGAETKTSGSELLSGRQEVISVARSGPVENRKSKTKYYVYGVIIILLIAGIYKIFFSGTGVPEGFVLVEGGTFQMGSNNGDDDEKPVHSVTLSDFYIGKYEVTVELWDRIMGTKSEVDNNAPSAIHKSYISWYDAIEFCNKLSLSEGLNEVYTINKTVVDDNNLGIWDENKWLVTANFKKNGYRLPTEAEWEYAARGRIKSGGFIYSGSNRLGEVGSFDGYKINENYEYTVNEQKFIGKYSPNELGIFDMSGGVSEWCWDWYGSYTEDSLINPTGPTKGRFRILRGGAWDSSAEFCRVSFRSPILEGNEPHFSQHPVVDLFIAGFGLRLVRSKL